MFTKKQVQDMIEKDLRQQVLIPLLRAMQYQGVHEYHGTTEFGKDIVCWDTDKLGNRENLALVVKATAVSGQSAASADIENQVRQCFSKPYIDPITGSEESVHRCWIVSNKPISAHAIELIKSGIGHAVYRENVTFIGIDRLWELVEKYLPLQAALQKLEDVRQDFETWDSHYRLDFQMDATGTHSMLAEKFPGAALEKPLTFRTVFEFPNEKDAEDLKRSFETGAPAKIPAKYIKNLEYPDILQQVLPPMGKDGFLHIIPQAHPKPLLLQCEVCCDDGDRFTIDYMHLICTQSGQKEATLTNEAQPITFKIQFVLRSDGTSQFHMEMKRDTPCNIHQDLRRIQFMHCLSKPHILRFTDLVTGISIGSSRSEVGTCQAPDGNMLEAFAALDALQCKSGRFVFLPERDLTDEEYQDINMLRVLFRTGKLRGSWKNASASTMITDENREERTQTLSQLAEWEGFYYLEQAEMLSLFNEEYTLGPIKPLFLPMKLANWTDVKGFLDQSFCGELRLEFIPRDDGSFTKEYVNWLPDCNDARAPTDTTDASLE